MLVIPGTASLDHLRANCTADQPTGRHPQN